MADFVMPILGADMEAGTLVAWRKQPGDRVERGEIVADVETDKGAIEVEIFTSGVIEELLVEPGAKVPVGTVLARLREDRPAPAAPAPAAAPTPAVSAPAIAAPAPAAPTPAPASARVRISPVARRRAEALGVDAASLRGTGPEGAITLEDVERAAAGTAAPAAPSDRQARMRQTIAAAMARAKREIPHFYLATTVDLHRATSWLAEQNARRPVTERLLVGVLLVKVVALALREVPELNAVWSDGRATPSPAIHVGVAISLRGGGLVAPALHDADRQSVGELMQSFRDLVKRVRAGTLRSSELSDPTVTVTSLGEQGVETVFPIIYPPQVAIVGFGRILDRPWSVNGTIVSRPLVNASLAADHRVTDGHRAGLFLAALDRLLQEPEKL
jgi:pyruvate dehydrogenase E2 component (dihydrolipoyllysine-residue acetyltransferase)